MAQRVLLKSANTNTQKGSVVDAPLEKKYICKLQVIKNKVIDDYLPIIPKNSRVINKTKVLFRLELQATITDKNTGNPVPGKTLKFKSSRDKKDKLTSANPTDKEGKTIVILETREQGDLKIFVKNPDVKMDAFPVSIKEAWYEARFILTHYVIFEESSTRFKGEKVNEYEGRKVKGGYLHKKDFLKEVKMQGSGRTGIPERPILKFYPKEYKYVQKIIGCLDEELKSNNSIAVDPNVLPFFHRVIVYFPSKNILGERCAEDKGDRIKGHHFDLFMGSEKERDEWKTKYGGTIHGAFVKYIGP